jgi:hypothetical protein
MVAGSSPAGRANLKQEIAMGIYYGLARSGQAFDFIRAACDVLGHGRGGAADLLLVETAMQETKLGTYRDPTPNGAGRGLFQCDEIAFIDVQKRAKAVDVYNVEQYFGFDLRDLRHDHLDLCPMAAAVFARLHYKLIPEEIPATVEGRAAYWKKYYNTSAGKGTELEYIKNAYRVVTMFKN